MVFTLPSDCQGKHGVPVWAVDKSSFCAGGWGSLAWTVDGFFGCRIPLSRSQLFWSHTGFGLGMT